MKISTLSISIDSIIIPRLLMRSTLSKESVEKLAESIKKRGLINPLTVVRKNNKFELVAGYRRLSALKLLKIRKADARVMCSREIETEIIKFHENAEREDVSPFEEGAYMKELMRREKLKQKELASLLSVSEAYVSDRVASTEWDKEIVDAVVEGKIPFTSARELARIKNKAVRDEYVHHATESGLSPDKAREWQQFANSSVVDNAAFESPADSEHAPSPAGFFSCECFVCKNKADMREVITVRVCKTCHSTITKPEHD